MATQAFAEHLRYEKIVQTDNGANRDGAGNARTERRIRMLTEAVRATLWEATAGIEDYEGLWGPALLHAADCINSLTGVE